MKLRILKKAVTAGLSFTLAMGMLPAIVGNLAVDAKLRLDVNDINLNINGDIIGIENPVDGSSGITEWTGSTVNYGGIEWNVIDKYGSGFGASAKLGSMLLFSTDSVGSMAYDNETVIWEDSDIRQSLNDFSNDSFAYKFNSVEQESLTSTEIYQYSWPFGDELYDMTYDKIFIPSGKDLIVQNGFIYYSEILSSCYWTRDHISNQLTSSLTMMMGNDADTDCSHVWGTDIYQTNDVRPEVNLNLDSILISSAAALPKGEFGLIDSSHVDYSEPWNLTLISDDSDFAANLPNTCTIGKQVNINVTEIGTGQYSQTSAMLVDENGNVVAYGKIGETGIGEITFTIPDSVAPGTYSLSVFEEQINDGTSSDYTSNVITQNLTVSEFEGYDVSISFDANSNVHLGNNSGATIQLNVMDAIDEITIAANEGYYFSEEFQSLMNMHGATGLTFEFVDSTTMTITGTPNGTVELMIPSATEKLVPKAPDNLMDNFGLVVGTTLAMEYAASPEALEWTDCSNEFTELPYGTWYFRYKATETAMASPVATATSMELKTYEFIAGANSKYVLGTNASLSFRVDGLLEKFLDLNIDGELVSADNYSLESGSTIVTFTPEYLNTLSVGTHNLNLTYVDGRAQTDFTILAASQTENNDPVVVDNKTTANITATDDSTIDNGNTDTGSTTNEASVVDTGDNTMLGGYVALVLLSAGTIMYLLRKRDIQ